MKRILLLTTGGTIASQISDCGLKPGLNAEEMLSYLHRVRELCHIDTVEICNIDSTNMTCEHWSKLVSVIQEQYDTYDGFVIAHGTDTLAYTAAALSYMIQNSEKPIVLTGAQKPIGFDSTDAKINLQDSILYAIDENSRGVQIVFDGKVILGTRAKKMMAVSYHAFSSINFPYLAIVRDGRIIRYIHQEPVLGPPRFFTEMNPKAFLLKLTPCSSPEIFESLLKAYDCIVIESFGAGGIPDRLFDELVRCAQAYEEGEKIIVIATQVMHEGSHVATYEVGKRLEGNLPYLEVKDMNLETALAKIMWIMGRGSQNWAEIEQLFYEPVAFDVVG